MEAYGLNELRKMFLDFFESKGHLVMDSFSLVPHNDESLLLINAGMAPLKPYFTGVEIPPNRRVATCQKCIRTGDIENIGKTDRHGTFFEMLGNFSFGDYFKKEAITWSWEFLTEVIGLDKDRLYPSVYIDDDEAFEIWNKDIGVSPDRIFKFGKEDNFWEHGAGPCGPCSEIYYDRGVKYGCGKPDCTVGCDCDRYIEVWNDVFTQFEGDGKGNYTTLENKNIDTGMGLERLAVVVQDVDSIFDVDTIRHLRETVCEMAGKPYRKNHDWDVSIRIITDHIRSATFMISDGIMTSNEGRGYVLRRLIRRALRHGRLLGITEENFLAKLSAVVIEDSAEGYPDLKVRSSMIEKILAEEESRFDKTIDTGLNILSGLEKKMSENGEKTLSGKEAFKLYDTYGFPLDLTKEILEEKGFTVDEDSFDILMKNQRETARKARKKTNYSGADETVYEKIDQNITSEFVGYNNLEYKSKVTAIATEDDVTEALTEGDCGTIVVEKTPFYSTMGGQVGDKGIISTEKGKFQVTETIKLHGTQIGHVGKMLSGIIAVGDDVSLIVDKSNRYATAKNHSATHLLQKALRIVLGDHVEQAGSYVDAKRLRFDFTHFQAMTPDEIKEAENIVNQQIAKKLKVDTSIMSLDEAKKTGAMALFGEKYGEQVRVVSMGDFSIELCGGTHVEETSDIACFKIISESGISSGVRRIEAITSGRLMEYYENIEKMLLEASNTAKTEPGELQRKIEQMHEEIKQLQAENEKLKSKIAGAAVENAGDNVIDVDGVSLIAVKVQDMEINSLRKLGDKLKSRLDAGVVAIFSSQNGKVNIVVMATEKAVERGAHAGNLIKSLAQIVGGGGGGRPNTAQAGGKDPSKIDDAIEKSRDLLARQLEV